MTPKEMLDNQSGVASEMLKEEFQQGLRYVEYLESRIQKLEAVAEAAMDALDHVKQYDSREFGTIGRLGQHVNTILERINKLLDDADGG